MNLFKKEGFIHCSLKDKVEESANIFFIGQGEILVLAINESKVKSGIIYEDLYNKNIKFPHIYGALNMDAVVETIELRCNENGTFTFSPKE